MILMTKNLDQEGLRSIVENYDLFYIDLWGVVHNGIKLHQEAIKVLNELELKSKEYVLLTNAPRPSGAVKAFLKNMNLEEKIRNHVFSSGEASLNYLKNNFSSKKFYHIGPPRDFDLFKEFEKDKSQSIENCEYLLCTGLFEKYDEDLNYYKDLFEKNNKKVLCIGDNLNTDIKGANLLNYDSLLISNGVHKKEIEKNGLDVVSKNYEAICNFTQSELKW